MGDFLSKQLMKYQPSITRYTGTQIGASLFIFLYLIWNSYSIENILIIFGAILTIIWATHIKAMAIGMAAIMKSKKLQNIVNGR